MSTFKFQIILLRAHFTRLKYQKLRIRDELRFLYIRKQKLNVKKKKEKMGDRTTHNR
jgi:hypothetical protein